MPCAKYPTGKYKEKSLYASFAKMPKEIRDRARQLFMLYVPEKKIMEVLDVEYPGITRGVGIKAFKAYLIKNRWKTMRERLEKRVVENVRYKGYETAVSITVQTAELLKRGLAHLNADGEVLGIRDMERISTIYERFDKIMRLEQSLPTEIIHGQLTKDKVVTLLKDIDYLDGLDDIDEINKKEEEILAIENEATAEDTLKDMEAVLERYKGGSTDEELEAVLELENSIED